MPWIALVALLAIAMLALEAIGAERNFRRRAGPFPGPEVPAGDRGARGSGALEGIGPSRAVRPPSPGSALSPRQFSSSC